MDGRSLVCYHVSHSIYPDRLYILLRLRRAWIERLVSTVAGGWLQGTVSRTSGDVLAQTCPEIATETAVARRVDSATGRRRSPGPALVLLAVRSLFVALAQLLPWPLFCARKRTPSHAYKLYPTGDGDDGCAHGLTKPYWTHALRPPFSSTLRSIITPTTLCPSHL